MSRRCRVANICSSAATSTGKELAAQAALTSAAAPGIRPALTQSEGQRRGSGMRRTPQTAWIAAAALWLAGCSTGPLQENPVLIRPDRVIPQENPLYIPQGPGAYPKVFEKALDVVDDFYEIAYSNRYEGRIETHPAIAPGLEQPWKPGSPDFYQRLLANFQTIQHRCILVISTAD